jgi:hypothetical protein
MRESLIMVGIFVYIFILFVVLCVLQPVVIRNNKDSHKICLMYALIFSLVLTGSLYLAKYWLGFHFTNYMESVEGFGSESVLSEEVGGNWMNPLSVSVDSSVRSAPGAITKLPPLNTAIQKYSQNLKKSNRPVETTQQIDKKIDKALNIHPRPIETTQQIDKKIDKALNIHPQPIETTQQIDKKIDKALNINPQPIETTQQIDKKIDKTLNIHPQPIETTQQIDKKIDKALNINPQPIETTQQIGQQFKNFFNI